MRIKRKCAAVLQSYWRKRYEAAKETYTCTKGANDKEQYESGKLDGTGRGQVSGSFYQ